MKKLITIIYFQIGVNVIGLPDIISHVCGVFYPKKELINESKYHK